jgi:acetamidase/formamidase
MTNIYNGILETASEKIHFHYINNQFQMLTISSTCKTFLILLLCSISSSLMAQKKGTQTNPYILNPSSKTVVWGHYWSETPPVLSIQSGDYVKVHTLIVGSPEGLEKEGVSPELIEKELREVQTIQDRGPGPHYLTGPIYIETAEAGDVLEVRIKSIELAIPYGDNVMISKYGGFLKDEIIGEKHKIIPLDNKKMIGRFSDGIEIPLRPFFGSLGVAPPKEAGKWNSGPPWIHAGNLDNKELVAGTTLFIPVHIKGALFQIGDGHAAQGNGEVCLSAIETSLKGELQFVLHKGKKLSWPRAETPTHFMSMGFDKDLTVASRIALKEMISFLMQEKNLSQVDAYMLCSVAADLSITQLVDGNVGVHAMLPKNIFTKK